MALTDGGSVVVGEYLNNTVSFYSMDGIYLFSFGIDQGRSGYEDYTGPAPPVRLVRFQPDHFSDQKYA